MALRGPRKTVETDILCFMNEVAEPGGIVTFSTFGSGIAHDNSATLVTYAADGSGKTPVGALMDNMVNIDQTRQHVNYYANEVNIGNKVTLMPQGEIVTNLILGTPSAGNRAYLGPSGWVRPDLHGTGGIAASPLVGQFLSGKDQLGYARVRVHLPQ